MTRYSSRKQEEFFQPARIQLVKHRAYSYSSQYHYEVVLRNVVTGEILKKARLVLRPRSCEPVPYEIDQYYSEWEDGEIDERHRWVRHTGDSHNKRQAIAAAKRLAMRDNLPFHTTQDIVWNDDIVFGHVRECVICEKAQSRGEKPIVCEDCMAHWNTGRMQAQELSPYLVGRYNVIKRPSGVQDEVGITIAAYLVELAGSTLGRKYGRPADPAKGKIVDSVGRGHEKIAYLKPAAWARIKKILEIIQQALFSAHSAGVKDGGYVLRKIQDGELPISKIDQALHMQKGEWETR